MPSFDSRLDETPIAAASCVQSAIQLLIFPPSVNRRMPVPSGRTISTCELSPPPGSVEKAIHCPSGDHLGLATESPRVVTMRGYPPSNGTVRTCGEPEMLVMNA